MRTARRVQRAGEEVGKMSLNGSARDHDEHSTGRLAGGRTAWLRRRQCFVFLLAYILIVLLPKRAMSQTPTSWAPIAKEELELKDNSLAPGEAAMVLYREVQTDNNKSLETHYTRIKIFNERGKQYADIEIPYVENNTEVQNIQARTVAPDGKSTDFDGRVFDKVVVKTRRFKVSVKAFTLAGVQGGSIIEYSYSLHWHNDIPDVIKHPEKYLIPGSIAYPAARWDVDRDLFIRHARFVLRPLSHYDGSLQIRSIRLPKDNAPLQQPDGTIQMDLENLPNVHQEEHSPPEEALRSEICFFYVERYYSNEDYWATLAKIESQYTDKFLAKSKAVHAEAARLVTSSDSPETKLHKIYDRVQQIRFISFEPTKSDKERKQENLKPNKHVEDVLTRDYAFANEVNLLFVALAREAGFKAYPVRVASRRNNFFSRSLPDPTQLNAEVVEVQLADKNIYLDPATLHCPFGLLPWEESDTSGIRLDQFPGQLVQIPLAASADAIIDRKGNFLLDKDGNLAGKLEVTFLGQEALERRLQEHDQDEMARKKNLEEEARSWLPLGATVKLTASNGWQGSNGAVHAVFEIAVPGFATQAGERLLFPISILQQSSKKPFRASTRNNPIYFPYGHQEIDELTVQPPQGYKVESLPVTRGASNPKGYSYKLETEEKGTKLTFKRNFIMESDYFAVERYPEIRDFYDFVRSNDEEQAVLQTPSGH